MARWESPPCAGGSAISCPRNESSLDRILTNPPDSQLAIAQVAVFYDGALNAQPNDITNVGLLSPYGTAGQGGNVWEWEESSFDLLNDSSSSARGQRGGFWGNEFGFLDASFRLSLQGPSFEFISFGFRVASIAIPEPSTLLLFCVGVLGVAALRRWPRRR